MATKTMGECSLRWNDHNTLLQNVCNSLLTSEKFADVTLYCEGVSLKCHKFLLSACSPYFNEILSETPCEHPVVIMRDVQYWQMQALLQFIYKGELTTDETKLSGLVELAQTLKIKGIGEFGPEETAAETTCNQNKEKTVLKEEPVSKEKDGMKDYLSLDSTLSERLMALPPESQQILGETLTASIEASDYSLQETEVEYTFQAGSLDDGQHIDQPILVQYPADHGESGGNGNACRKRRRAAESEASSSDASASATGNVPIYKKYTDENLLAAVKAVLEHGMKQSDATEKYGVPITTLARKIRQYQLWGCLLPTKKSRRSRPSRASRERASQVSLACRVLPIDNEPNTAIRNDSAVLESDGRVVVIVSEPEPAPVPPKAQQPPVKHYKTYTEEDLRAAIAAVLERGVRAQQASYDYNIPLTTLNRKIRSLQPAATAPFSSRGGVGGVGGVVHSGTT